MKVRLDLKSIVIISLAVVCLLFFSLWFLKGTGSKKELNKANSELSRNKKDLDETKKKIEDLKKSPIKREGEDLLNSLKEKLK